MLNWSDLLAAEPRLVRVEHLSLDAHADGLCWADFWRHVQPELVRLVGALAGQPELRSTSAYTTALQHCQTLWAHGDGSDAWRSPRPWDGVAVAWHEAGTVVASGREAPVAGSAVPLSGHRFVTPCRPRRINSEAKSHCQPSGKSSRSGEGHFEPDRAFRG